MRPSAKGLTFLHLIPPWLLASLFWPPTDETSEAPNMIPNTFLWKPLAGMTHSNEYVPAIYVSRPSSSHWPLPQRAPLTCPLMSPNSLLAVWRFTESSSPPFCASHSSTFLCHQPAGERKHIFWFHLMCNGHTLRCICIWVYTFKKEQFSATETVRMHRFVVVESYFFGWKLKWCHGFLPRSGEQTPATLLT